jgi:transposase
MEDRPATIPSAAPHCDPARVVLAIEMSSVSWIVAVLTPLAAKISLQKVAAHDASGLIALMWRQQQQATAALGRPVEIVSCYEAGYDGFWLHRRLAQAGITNHVLDPASLQVNRRARRAKTDRLDAQALLRALLAHLRGEPKVVSVVRVPSPAEEDARRLTRERERLLCERIQHVNRIKGLLAGQGIYDYQPLKADRWRRLAELATGDGRTLPPRLQGEIRRELKRLELVLAMLAELTAERKALLRAPQPSHPAADQITKLLQLKAIGPELASVLAGEVFYRAFANRREVAGYVGLTEQPFASGAKCRDQGISKAGNARARTSLIELAWLWLRHQPDSALSAWFWARVGAQKGRVRRIAIVALARKLAVALWRYLETGIVPTGAQLKDVTPAAA